MSRFSDRSGSRPVFWTVVIVSAVLVLLAVPIASAHANLVEASPGNGEQVAEPPDELTLQYTEGIQRAGVSVELASGDRVDEGVRVDADDPAVVHVPLDDPENGTYVVTWEVLSVDGHTTSGALFFTVGDEPPSREQLLSAHEEDSANRSVNPLEPVFRALLLGGGIVLVGAPVTLLFVVYPLASSRDLEATAIDRRTVYLMGGAILGVLLSSTVLAGIRMTAAQPLSVDVVREFSATGLGRAWLVQICVALVLGFGTVLGNVWRRDLSRRAWLGGAVAGGLLVQATISVTSHSAAVTD